MRPTLFREFLHYAATPKRQKYKKFLYLYRFKARQYGKTEIGLFLQ